MDFQNGIAIDIGTTTIAFALVQGGHVATMTSMTNSQCVFGVDASSRIKAANEGHGEQLRNALRKDLAQGMKKLAKQARDTIDEIVITGDAVMLRFLCDDSTEEFCAPSSVQTPLRTEQKKLGEWIEEDALVSPDTPVTFLPEVPALVPVCNETKPGFAIAEDKDMGGQCDEKSNRQTASPVVGADVLAGLFYLKAWEWEKPCLFMDLGSSAKMVIGDRHCLRALSVDGGPSLEGGKLSCGVGSVDGAICSVDFQYASPKVKTIGGAEPIGICGTGALEALVGMRENGYLDATGLLREPYFSEGFPVYSAKSALFNTLAEEMKKDVILTQADVRELQMTKATLRSKMEAILRETGYTYDDIEKVYLAGGFSYRLEVSKAVKVGLIPGELEKKTESVGNASLGGATEYLLAPELVGKVEDIKERITVLSLDEEEGFADDYMRYLFFV